MELYVLRNGQKMGPYTPEEVRSSLAAGSVHPTDLAWREGAPEWKPLASIPGFGADAPPAVPRQIIPPPPPSSPTSGLAIASLVLGIVSLLSSGLTGIPAVICGHVSLSQIKKDPMRISGSGFAIAGLVMGYFGIALMAMMIVMMVLVVGVAGVGFPMIIEAIKQAPLQNECIAHERAIAAACKSYARDHDGQYPVYLTDLVPKYIASQATLACPMKWDSSIGYEYFGPSKNAPGTQVLLISKGETWAHQKVVATCNGKVTVKATK